MPLKAALVLDEDFQTTRLNSSMLNSHVIMSHRKDAGEDVGGPLQIYAKETASRIFQTVEIYATTAEAANKADVILVPHIVQSTILQSTGGIMNEKVINRIIFTVEWAARDKENKGIIWLDTVEADVSKVIVNSGFDIFSGTGGMVKALEQLHQEAFNELGGKTARVLLQSPEINKLSGLVGPASSVK